MSVETPDAARDAELGQLRADFGQLQATVARQEALIETLLAERTATAPAPAPRRDKRARPTPNPTSPPSLEDQPTSRRGLLKRLGAGTAGAAAAVLAGRAIPAEASFDGTKVGESTTQYGIYAARDSDARPAVGVVNTFGVLGTLLPGMLTPDSVPNAGVAGFSQDIIGVTGRSKSSVGVYGLSDTGSGVRGVIGALVLPANPNYNVAGTFGASSTRAGVVGVTEAAGYAAVHGYSNQATGMGVFGQSGGHGVFGRTSAAAGTVVEGMLAAGLAGRTAGTIALYGYSDGPPNANYAPVGAVGQCESGFGVWGLSSAGPGAASKPGGGTTTAISGVLGTSTSGVGVYAISSGAYALAAEGNGPTSVAVFGRAAQAGGKAAVFVGPVEIQGHLTVTGGINGPVGQAATRAPADSRGAPPSLQAVQSPEALVEGIGEGRLVGGQAEVRLDAALVALLPDDQYHVVLTEYDDHSGLYVTGRTRQGFTVRAKDSPTAGGTFSYRVVGRSPVARTAADAAPLHTPTIPVPQGVPTLPVGRETSPAAPVTRPDAR
jgi:hypothetical protein